MSTAEQIINLAKAEVGYHEGNGNVNKYAEFIDNNYPEFYNGKKNGYAWCDVFVDYLFLKSFGLEEALRLTCQPFKSAGAGCKFSMQYYIKRGRFRNKPVIGSQIFFGDSSGEVNHTGIVVDFTSDTVWTIEGNSSDKVAERMYSLSYARIAGYGVPDYSEDVVPEPPKPNIDKIVLEVLDGKWGNGEERKRRLTQAGYDYSEVQRRINQYLAEEVELRINLSTETIYHLQGILKSYGYDVTVNGIMDESTRTKLKKFAAEV